MTKMTADDVVLEVNYTFPWDFPFVLRHQNSSVILLSGKGKGPMSGAVGARNVAKEFTKAAKSFRPSAPKKE